MNGALRVIEGIILALVIVYLAFNTVVWYTAMYDRCSWLWWVTWGKLGRNYEDDDGRV